MLSKAQRQIIMSIRWTFGLIFSVNFLVFWALPIGIQGMTWQAGASRILRPLYTALDDCKPIRQFAHKFIYSKEVHTDYFVQAVMAGISSLGMLSLVSYWQITNGSLPLWLIMAYNFAWVGFGGRTMGAAYTYSHQEGHRRGGGMYRPWIAKSIGNVWENWMGLMFGNVPYNFSTSHVFLHHRLNAGKGDPFYMWDVDRSSLSDFMLYAHRIFVYMTGFSSLKVFSEMAPTNKMAKENRDMLMKGMVTFWIILPAMVFTSLGYAGCSPASILSFYFFVFLQPLCCMSFFLALINVSFHGFIEFDETGRHIACVNSDTIIDGTEDSYGEDDHMAHHYYTSVSHRDLAAHQATQKEVWIKHHASVFNKISIMEVSIFMLFNLWDKLATHYVDYSGKMTQAEIATMLETRAKRKEMTYEEYEFDFLPTIRQRAEALVAEGVCTTVEQAFKEIAHTNHPLRDTEISPTKKAL